MSAPLFIDSELQALGDVFQDTILTDSCAILRYARVDDGQGGFTETWVTSNTVPCLVSGQPALRQFQMAQQDVAKGIQSLLLPRNTDIRIRDRVQVNGLQVSQVIDVAGPTTLEVLRRATIQLLVEAET